MFFTRVFTKETDILAEFHTASENTIGLISFTVNKVKSKLEESNRHKSARVDRLHPRIWKELSESYQHLHRLFSEKRLLKVNYRKIGKTL